MSGDITPEDVKARRAQLGLTLEEAAQLAGVSTRTAARVEAGTAGEESTAKVWEALEHAPPLRAGRQGWGGQTLTPTTLRVLLGLDEEQMVKLETVMADGGSITIVPPPGE